MIAVEISIVTSYTALLVYFAYRPPPLKCMPLLCSVGFNKS
nr:MAG TPA: hypothetical protein [Caudoviricetes sp.]